MDRSADARWVSRAQIASWEPVKYVVCPPRAGTRILQTWPAGVGEAQRTPPMVAELDRSRCV